MAKKDDIGIVVDDNDNVIAYKKYTDMVHGERRRITCTYIFNDAGELLVQQRSKTKRVLPGYWGPSVSGGVESHETYESNALKEAEEELGLTNLDLKFHGSFPFDYESHKEMSGIFTAAWNGDPKTLTLQESEVDDVRWITLEELQKWLDTDIEKVAAGIPKQLKSIGYLN